MKEDFAEQCLHKDFPSMATLKQILVGGASILGGMFSIMIKGFG